MHATGDTSVEQYLAEHPDRVRVFVRLGLPCFECGEPAWGTIGELCRRHGREPGEVLAALNADSQDAARETKRRARRQT